MNLLVPLPEPLFWLCFVCGGALAFWAAITAPWRKLAAVSARQHLWFGACAALGISWAYMGVTVLQIFRLHPMLVTVLTLVFGFRLAILCGAGALLVTLVLGNGSGQALPFNWLLGVVLPALITLSLLRLVARLRIQNLFLYTLGVGFAGGLLTPPAIALVSFVVLWGFQPFFLPIYTDNMYLLFLFTFPEGFMNGMITSALAVMAPHLVKTYDDDFYLR